MEISFIVAIAIFLLFISFILVASINYLTRVPQSQIILELRDKNKDVFNQLFGSAPTSLTDRVTTNLYRVPILLSEQSGTAKTNEVVAAYINFDDECKDITSWNNTVRVYDQKFNELQSRISYQEFCSSQWLNRSIVTFFVNMSANENKKVYVYSINNSGTIPPRHNITLVGYWPLNENSGTLARDYSGYQNNGTLTSGPTWVSGRYDYGVNFNGTDYIDVPTTFGIPTGNMPYTIAAWFKVDAFSGAQGIVGWGNWGTTNQVNALRLQQDVCGGSNLGVRNYWQSNDLGACTSYTAVGGWSHLAATFDGVTRIIYLNGTQIASDTPSGHNVPNSSNFRIGSTNNGEYFNGTIDEVKIYNRSLSVSEIQTLANVTPTVVTVFPKETITAISGQKLQTLITRDYSDVKSELGGAFDFRVEVRENK